MYKVRAKFVCVSNEETSGDQTILKMSAVTSGSDENKSFSRWTPAANLEMYISNETEAGKSFEVGKEYYLDFTLAE
jgi:hypothetical protein